MKYATARVRDALLKRSVLALLLALFIVAGATSPVRAGITPPPANTPQTSGFNQTFAAINYGAFGDTQGITGNVTGVMSSVTNPTQLTILNGTFLSTDPASGKYISVTGAGAAGVPLVTTIATYINATTVTLASPCLTTVNGVQVTWGHDDTTAILTAENATALVAPFGGSSLNLGGGVYTLSLPIIATANVSITGVSPYNTILYVKAGSNSDGVDSGVISGSTMASSYLSDSGTTNVGQANFALNNLTFDGNKANNTSGYGARLYGYDYLVGDCVFRNFANNGFITEWDGTAASPNSIEAKVKYTKFYNNGAGALNIGPHDSEWNNDTSYANYTTSTGNDGSSEFAFSAGKAATTSIAINSSNQLVGAACPGINYTTSATGTVVSSSTGSGCTVALTIRGGRVISGVLTAGTSYPISSTGLVYVTVSGGGGTNAFGVVTVNGSGVPTTVSFGTSGFGYLPWLTATCTLTAGTGSGGSVTPIIGAASNQIVGYTIVPGSWTVPPTATITGGTTLGSGNCQLTDLHAYECGAYGYRIDANCDMENSEGEGACVSSCLLDSYNSVLTGDFFYATYGSFALGTGLQIGSAESDANSNLVQAKFGNYPYYCVQWVNSTGANKVDVLGISAATPTGWTLGSPNASDTYFPSFVTAGTNQTPIYASDNTQILGNVLDIVGTGGQAFGVGTTNAGSGQVFYVTGNGTPAANVLNGAALSLFSGDFSTSTGQWTAADGHLHSGGTATATFTAGSGITSAANTAGFTSNDLAGNVTCVVSASPPLLNSELCQVTYTHQYSSIPKAIVITSTTLGSTLAPGDFYVQNSGQNSFQVFLSIAPTLSTTITFSYAVIQ